MNIKLLASLEELLDKWIEANSGEEWFPRIEWTDDTTPLLVRMTHDALMAIEASSESLRELFEKETNELLGVP